MDERRRLARWQIERPVKIKLEGSPSYVDCIVSDLNQKGLKIILKRNLPLDKFLKLSIMLTESLQINVEAWSAWHKKVKDGYVHGLIFTKIRNQDREDIYRFVLRHCSDQVSKQWWSSSTPSQEETGLEPVLEELESEPVTEENLKPEEVAVSAKKEGGEKMEKVKENFEDRRTFARFPVSLSLKYLDLGSNREGQAQTCDISAKGIGMLSQEKLTPHTSLELWLQMPDKSEPFYTRGEVVWSESASNNEFRAGVNLEKADLMGVSRVLRTS